MSIISKIWNNHWFKEVKPEFLAIQRILFYGFLAFYFIVFEGQYFWSWSMYPQEFWQPVGVFKLFNAPPFNGIFLFYIEKYWPILLILSALGFFTRLFTFLSFLVPFIFIGCSLSYGEGSYDHLIGLTFLFVFACSRCGDALSLDSLFFKKSIKIKKESYFWPIRLQQWLFCSFFMGAGLSKLYVAGIGWIFSDTLSNLILYSHYGDAMSPWATELGFGLWVASIPWLSKTLAGGTIFLELFCPLAIILPKLYRRIFITAHLLMIIGFYFVATEGFMNLVGLYFCWFADLFYDLYLKARAKWNFKAFKPFS